ncbi:protein-L-isoaspartate O-methyltransferase family protein [Hellea balneolensis]|uniref:protein-L-isoaspartate O-methyltransferase family protein n=1 Tax=Hellea balneolensis TaxID=287478 RepID=UPI000427CACF|nr:protein-L-isoaspartate O-methyltransferase [Hellea balneolensis]
MFDFSSARDHMVESQIRTSDVTDLELLGAFRRVSREKFIPKSQQALAYGDAHIDLGDGRTMIRPRDFAKMIQAAEIMPTDVVLDIACGRGYSTAILSYLCETVVGLEENDEAVERATNLLIDADITNAAVVKGDLKSGASEHGPFNVIFVNGAICDIPKTWLDQLANNGRLVCLVQNGPIGRVCVYTKAGNTVGERIIFDASAPVLTGFAAEPEFVF